MHTTFSHHVHRRRWRRPQQQVDNVLDDLEAAVLLDLQRDRDDVDVRREHTGEEGRAPPELGDVDLPRPARAQPAQDLDCPLRPAPVVPSPAVVRVTRTWRLCSKAAAVICGAHTQVQVARVGLRFGWARGAQHASVRASSEGIRHTCGAPRSHSSPNLSRGCLPLGTAAARRAPPPRSPAEAAAASWLVRRPPRPPPRRRPQPGRRGTTARPRCPPALF
eukprot:7378998-Prymnesium_polylepis.1